MKNNKLKLFLISLLLLISGCSSKSSKAYGVFLGLNSTQINKTSDYHFIILEPSEFSPTQIQQLHNNGKIIYAYLNIGAIEKYRPYYNHYSHLTLSNYENWDDEQWIDVSDSSWQTFITNNIASNIIDMGYDGLFLDNFDIYHHYPTDAIYQGLLQILSELKNYQIPLIINGGDTFVTRYMTENTNPTHFDGINQESVFTSIDFDTHIYSQQTPQETAYYQNYLAKAKQFGLSVYLLEYQADQELSKTIDSYCEQNGYHWYNAMGLELQ